MEKEQPKKTIEDFGKFIIEILKMKHFITEDGVLLFNDDDLVWYTHDFESNSHAILLNPYFLEQTPVKYAKQLTKDRKFFSTKKAAENYRKCHIKCISFNDVWNLSNNKSSDNNYIVISKSDLTKLVKERMSRL